MSGVEITRLPTPEELEERALLGRVEDHEHAYCIRPASIAAAQRLMRRGEISGRWGEGKDAGILICRRGYRRSGGGNGPFGDGSVA